MILAPFATAAVLATLWLVVKLALDWAAEDGSKIVAALKGRSWAAQPEPTYRAVTVRYQPRAGSVRRPLRAAAAWRDAA
ncbi:hypothetical protein ABDK56_01555 [Sphingomonas sp. ASV193]|uniref:hypothetical protein n=1 Tax=Sphingomonas sp. ASV193 TaxID=3144405 RepID=UPI0032E8DBB1